MFARILIAALACTGLVFAQADSAKAAKPAKAKGAAASMISGTVSSVDAIGNTVIVKSKKAEDTLSVDTATVIKSGGKKIALGDLKADTPVSVTFKVADGKKVALKIIEKVAAAAPAKGKAAKEPAKEAK